MNRPISVVVGLAALGVWAAGAWGQVTLHVATPAMGGSDANSGTAAAPLATIQRAANLAQPGDTVVVGPGTFTGFNVGGGVTAEGTPAAPITFRGTRGPDGSWLTVIDTEAARFNGTTHHARINIDTASWITIEDFEVVGVHDQRFSKAGVRIVMPPSGSDGHITVRRCHIHDNGEWGVFSGHVHHITVEDCLIHHQVDEHGIYLSNSGDDHIIRNNVIHSNSANGIHLNSDASQGGDGVMQRLVVERNTIYNNGGGSTYVNASGQTVMSAGGGSGINCDGIRDSVIANNVLYDNHAGGITLYRIDGLLPSSGNLVVNNTVLMASDGRWALNVQDGSAGNVVFNNIFLNNHPSRGSIVLSDDTVDAGGIISDYNIVMNRMDPGTGSAQTLATWRAATGQDLNSILAPTATWADLFVDLAGRDFHLVPTSAARNAGVAMLAGRSAPAADRDGVSRPAESGFDIGAYEVGGATPPCIADFNGSGGLSVQDIFDFLAGYFAGDPRADVNGVGGLSVQDVFDFLAAYFEGCD